MTRRETIEAIVDDQIKRGVIDKSMRAVQIHYRLKGIGFAKPMSYEDCVKAYEGYFKKQ